MKFILTTMAFVAAAAMGAITAPQEVATVTITVTNCDSSVAGISTSIRTVTASNTIISATESIAPTPVGPVSESVLSTSFRSATEAMSSATISSVVESATATLIYSVGETSVTSLFNSSIIISTDVVSPATASIDLSTSWKSASASESSLASASESAPTSQRTATSASVTPVPSNDATSTGMVGMTCIMAVVVAALFNLA